MRGDLGDGKGHRGSTLKPRLRQALIAGQAAMVLMVLAGAALLVRSAINLQHVSLGFDTAAVLRARVGLPGDPVPNPRAGASDVPGPDGSAVVRAGRRARGDRLAGAAVARRGSNGLIPEGRPLQMESIINSRSHFVSPDYFRLLRIPVSAGRGFEPTDVRGAPLVMIVNQTLAREAFGPEPVGKRITCCEGDPEIRAGRPSLAWLPTSGRRARRSIRTEFYLPVAQIPDVAWSWVENTMDVMVRSAGDPTALAGLFGAPSRTSIRRCRSTPRERWTRGCGAARRKPASTCC